ncbi:hypothetical protein KBD81_05810 [Candidatus Woesebacteria bacterium]|nr:hypothetical protein [Candidatus Woesebacteria bacterium]
MAQSKKNIIVCFGGVSAEHEVSIISGLQIVETIDRTRYSTCAIYLTKDGYFQYLHDLRNRHDFKSTKPQNIAFGRDENGSFFVTTGIIPKKTYIDGAYLSFHGGIGESGQVQGLLTSLRIPFTSPDTESSAICMNKVLTKEVVETYGIQTVPWVRVLSTDVKKNLDVLITEVLTKLDLPMIVKPTHLGSSIGIEIAKSDVELKKALLAASAMDTEIIIEPYLSGFIEYNASVRSIDGTIEVSKIERPISHDAILSFADKYERGSKKSSGMAALDRELPARITKELESEITELARTVFKLVRAKGMLRIDFMLYKNKVYLTEVNPIPGSMSFYLWEATGISFKDQITALIEQAIKDSSLQTNLNLEYSSDIIDRFIS